MIQLDGSYFPIENLSLPGPRGLESILVLILLKILKA